MGDVTLDNIKALLEEQTSTIRHDVKKTVAEITEKLGQRDAKITRLHEKYLSLEWRNRKNNVIVFGLQGGSTDIIQHTLDKINHLLGLNLEKRDVNNVYRLGRNENSPIKIEFISFLRKLELFKNKERLKLLKGEHISITNDLCEEDRGVHKVLVEHLKEARRDNKRARIRGNKLQIENVWYTAKDLGMKDSSLETTSDSYESSSEESETEDRDSKITEGSTEHKYREQNKTTHMSFTNRQEEKKRKAQLNTSTSPPIAQKTRNRKKRKF